MCHTSSLINHQLRVYYHLPVVSPFSPREEQDDKQRDDGDDAAGCCPDSRIFDCFCESVELGESRFPGHLGSSSAGLVMVPLWADGVRWWNRRRQSEYGYVCGSRQVYNCVMKQVRMPLGLEKAKGTRECSKGSTWLAEGGEGFVFPLLKRFVVGS